MLGRSETFGFFPFPRREVIIDVPSSEVERVARDFRDSGAEEVTVERQDDGNYRVTATFPG
jgi:hypothetical protein